MDASDDNKPRASSSSSSSSLSAAAAAGPGTKANIVDLTTESAPPCPPPPPSSSSSSHQPAVQPRFDGKGFYLNKLDDDGGGADVTEEELGLLDIFESLEQLQSVVVASFGYDPCTFDTLRIPPHVPITVISDADCHEVYPQGVYESLTPEGRSYTLVVAVVEEPTIDQGVKRKAPGNHQAVNVNGVSRGHGVFHPKLVILQYQNFLRIVICSTNFTQRDWQYYNQVNWVYDAPRRAESSIGESEKTDCKAFSYQLIRYFVEILVEPKELRSAGEEVFERLKEMFKSYDINPPPNVHLVASVPGYHSDKRKVYVDKEAKKYKVVSMPRFGQARLRQVLEGDKCQHVAFQMSSFGFMDLDFVEEMVSSTGTSHFSIIWPTDEQALSRRGKGCLVLSDTNVNFLVNANAGAVRGDRSSLRMQRLDVPQPHRCFTMNHSKVMVGLPSSSSSTPSPNFIYIGSHNMSRAAWGKFQSDGKIKILSYELGVLIKDPGPALYQRLPFDPYSPLYRIEEPREEPFSPERHLSRLVGCPSATYKEWDRQVDEAMEANIARAGCTRLKFLPCSLGKALIVEDANTINGLGSSAPRPLLACFINIGHEDEYSNQVKRALSDPVVLSVLEEHFIGVWLCPVGDTVSDVRHHQHLNLVKSHFKVTTATLTVLRTLPSGSPPRAVAAHLIGPMVKLWQASGHELQALVCDANDRGPLATKLVEAALSRAGEAVDDGIQLQLAIELSLQESRAATAEAAADDDWEEEGEEGLRWSLYGGYGMDDGDEQAVEQMRRESLMMYLQSVESTDRSWPVSSSSSSSSRNLSSSSSSSSRMTIVVDDDDDDDSKASSSASIDGSKNGFMNSSTSSDRDDDGHGKSKKSKTASSSAATGPRDVVDLT